ncbi:MAG: DegV family protein [Lachnospiraceae bacterium]|nr:DegV family protein [Lachnospiraceae bacterium]
MAFAVVTDTSGNLPKELVDQAGIYVIPLTYHFEGEEHTCLDVAAFDGASFFGKMRAGEPVTTSQIAPQTFLDVFTPILERGEDIIYICMASGISGTFNSVNLAAFTLKEDFPEREIQAIDTKGAALGEGFVALEAARLRDAGMDTLEAADYLRDYSWRMCNVFTVDDLMFLKRGGRLSNVAAIVGTVLGIKPLLKGSEDATIVAFAKVRGRKKSIKMLAERYETLVEKPEEQTIGIVDADCAEDADTLEELIRGCSKPPKEILRVPYEPVTGSHVGPGALALFFLGREDVRTALEDFGSISDRAKKFLTEVRTKI